VADQEQDIATLKGQAESLKVTLDQMRKRIEELQAELRRNDGID
jgi:septal ring factor EnvC (AmiA/AmiB activator)